MQHKTLDVSIAIPKVVMRIDLRGTGRGTGNFTMRYTAGQLPHYYQPTIAILITSH